MASQFIIICPINLVPRQVAQRLGERLPPRHSLSSAASSIACCSTWYESFPRLFPSVGMLEFRIASIHFGTFSSLRHYCRSAKPALLFMIVWGLYLVRPQDDHRKWNNLLNGPHWPMQPILHFLQAIYRVRLHFAQSTFKKDPGRARWNSLATEGTNFTKPGAQNKVDPCMAILGRA